MRTVGGRTTKSQCSSEREVSWNKECLKEKDRNGHTSEMCRL